MSDERMSTDERRKYLKQMQKRYQAASRGEKGKLLDEMAAVTGQHRKGLIRLMNGGLERRPRQRQRGKRYGAEVKAVIGQIAESLDYLCAEHLQPNLGWMADHLAAHGELEISDAVRQQLETVSISTVRRLLKRQPRDLPPAVPVLTQDVYLTLFNSSQLQKGEDDRPVTFSFGLTRGILPVVPIKCRLSGVYGS